MIARLLMAAALACATAGCVTSEELAERGGNLDRITAERLERFESESAFRQYLRDAQRETRRQGGWWAGREYPRTSPVGPFSAPEPDDEEAIIVTGTRLVRQDFEAMSPVTAVGAEQLELTATLTTDSLLSELPSITNNQERGVDEGDIVKRIGRFLVVLQDGRLFTVDLLPNGSPGLRFVDRENVYRATFRSSWIDEMLVFGRRIVVTGYSYRERATEVSIFVMSDAGELTREAVYYISSNDYYDPENYATRIVGDNLVFYTPLGLRSVDPDLPLKWPVVRRWLRDNEREAVLSEGQALFDATDIYRPLQETTAPTVYTISVCPLRASARGADLNCRSTAFVAPPDREVYVSTEHIYVWTAEERWGFRGRHPDRCEAEDDSGPAQQLATLYQVALRGGAVRALRTQGMPPNQFAMAAAGGEFRALLQDACDDTRLTYFHAPLGVLSGDRPAFANTRRYVTAPSLESDDFEVRFTEDYLAYGERSQWGTWPPDEGAPERPGRLVVLSTRNPAQTVTLAIPHEVIRLERLANDMVLTGYRDRRGLSVSRLDLSGGPRIGDTLLLEGRFETEGRSHAFNATMQADGGGALGLPTAGFTGDLTRLPWESDDSDVTFLTFDPAGRFGFAGTLQQGAEPDAAYSCEVSCVDWYGNARPIFIAGRVFALTGADLVEGELRDGRMHELRRVDLTAQH